MSNAYWIQLRSEEIAPAFHPADASWVTESPSPYEIPSHARASYDPETGCLTIEFKYFEPEDLRDIQLDPYFDAKVGKRTRRIWSIIFNAHKYSRDRKRITDAAEATVASSGKRVSNATIAARAIHQKGDALLRAAFG